MKKIFKSFAFWGVVTSLLIILVQQLGYDSKSLSLIYFNPILNLLSKNDAMRSFMQSGYQIHCPNLVTGDTISIYWYIGSVITCFLYGGVVDLIRFGVKKLLRASKNK